MTSYIDFPCLARNNLINKTEDKTLKLSVWNKTLITLSTFFKEKEKLEEYKVCGMREE